MPGRALHEIVVQWRGDRNESRSFARVEVKSGMLARVMNGARLHALGACTIDINTT